MKSHRVQIREHLLEGLPLTKLDGLRLYGCMNVGARIEELRRIDNLPITTRMVRTSSGKQVAEYRYDGETAGNAGKPS